MPSGDDVVPFVGPGSGYNYLGKPEKDKDPGLAEASVSGVEIDPRLLPSMDGYFKPLDPKVNAALRK